VFVVFGDLDEKEGTKLESELCKRYIPQNIIPTTSTWGCSLLSSTKFVKCNVTKWDDQLKLFDEAAKRSPSGKISYVVANAGVALKDEVFSYAGKPLYPNS